MPPNKQWNILCWNVRGINSEKKQLAIRNAIDVSGCSVVCLQETKRTSFDASFVKLFCPKKFDMFAWVPSSGASGGLITVWMSSVFTGVPVFSESFALGVRLTSTQSVNSWIRIERCLFRGCSILIYHVVMTGSSWVILTSSEHRTIVIRGVGTLMTC